MRLQPRHLLTGGIIATALSLLPAGCADNESSLFVRGVMKVDPPGCEVTADPSEPLLLGGTLDLAFRETYTAALLVGNQLTPRGSRDQLRTETSRISLRGAEITVLSPDESVVTEFTVPGTGFVDPGDGENAGYGTMFVQLVAGADVSGLPFVVVEVQVFGETLGGRDIESNTLTFPISICNGCLAFFPQDAIDPVTGACNQGQPDGELPCFPGQDFLVDCRFCSQSNAACQ